MSAFVATDQSPLWSQGHPCSCVAGVEVSQPCSSGSWQVVGVREPVLTHQVVTKVR